ncbi:MAG: ABC transporter ATP-binding protein, partial [Lentisphaerae bacterium]
MKAPLNKKSVDTSIRIEHLSKKFVLNRNAGRSLKSKFVGLFNKRYREEVETFWALRDVSLEIPAGTTMGVIGANGSGKSTLLKVVAGILSPNEGKVEYDDRAKVGTLIELGVGFCPELTGRENIYLNASLYGFNRE